MRCCLPDLACLDSWRGAGRPKSISAGLQSPPYRIHVGARRFDSKRRRDIIAAYYSAMVEQDLKSLARRFDYFLPHGVEYSNCGEHLYCKLGRYVPSLNKLRVRFYELFAAQHEPLGRQQQRFRWSASTILTARSRCLSLANFRCSSSSARGGDFRNQRLDLFEGGRVRAKELPSPDDAPRP